MAPWMVEVGGMSWVGLAVQVLARWQGKQWSEIEVCMTHHLVQQPIDLRISQPLVHQELALCMYIFVLHLT